MFTVQSRAGLYEKWAANRRAIRAITEHLSGGGRVVIATMTRATTYGPKHAASFKATKTGMYVQRGKSWDCIGHGHLYVGVLYR